jgi:hypothetical protein
VKILSLLSGILEPKSGIESDKRDALKRKIEELTILLSDARLMSERWEQNLSQAQIEKDHWQPEELEIFHDRAEDAKRNMATFAYRAALLMSEMLSDALGAWTPSPDHVGFGLSVDELTTLCEMSGNEVAMAGKVME